MTAAGRSRRRRGPLRDRFRHLVNIFGHDAAALYRQTRPLERNSGNLASDEEFAAVRKELFRFIEKTRGHCGRRRKDINDTIGSILQTM